MSKEFSTKRIAIDKAYATVVIVVAAAAFLVVFSLVASKELLGQRAYQSKVIDKREAAREILKNNIASADQLTAAYTEFVSAPTNALGGNPQGDGDRDGDNARIILDALPSKYDYPALATSVDKLFRENGLLVSSILGNDDEIAQATAPSSASPTPVEIPISVDVDAAPHQGNKVMELMERSIRPFHVRSLSVSSDKSTISLTIDAVTYFQPQRNLELKKEVVN